MQRAREKIYEKLKHLDLAHPDHNQLEFSPVPWCPPSDPPPPLPPPRDPPVFKSISLSKGLQHLDPNVLSPTRDVPPPVPARPRRVQLSRKPLPVVPHEKDEDKEEPKSSGTFESVKPVEYKGDDIVGIMGGLDRLQVFHRQQGARKVIPRAHSTDTESDYGSRANSRDIRSSSKDKRIGSKSESRIKSKDSRVKTKESKPSREARDTIRSSSADKRSHSRRQRAKSLEKHTRNENLKEKRASSSSNERPPPPPVKNHHSSSGAPRPPPLSLRNVSVSDSSSVYEERFSGYCEWNAVRFIEKKS